MSTLRLYAPVSCPLLKRTDGWGCWLGRRGSRAAKAGGEDSDCSSGRVVPLDVVASTPDIVVLPHPPDDGPTGVECSRPPCPSMAADIDKQKRQEIEDGANLNVVAAVHLGVEPQQ